tara:strand:- start:128 stop:334 length:207 start_codon:yes stop_codon:yes gene_type:complete
MFLNSPYRSTGLHSKHVGRRENNEKAARKGSTLPICVQASWVAPLGEATYSFSGNLTHSTGAVKSDLG